MFDVISMFILFINVYVITDFSILRVVTMDPSQLFGAWLDDTTFLGGSLEISLDRFATTVQIEAHEVHVCSYSLFLSMKNIIIQV